MFPRFCSLVSISHIGLHCLFRSKKQLATCVSGVLQNGRLSTLLSLFSETDMVKRSAGDTCMK